MSLLTPTELAAIEDDMSIVWPDTAQQIRPSYTNDGFGGRGRAWTTIATLPCRVNPLREGAESVEADAMRNEKSYVVSVPLSASVRLEDRLIISGTTFAVQTLNEPRSVKLEHTMICEQAAA